MATGRLGKPGGISGGSLAKGVGGATTEGLDDVGIGGGLFRFSPMIFRLGIFGGVEGGSLNVGATGGLDNGM